ncbi:MAG: SPOR domain-containing protein [Betaproteobacteria bacterium]|nr:SPOR domain-containing protein [Betaproteobacteria bacterium]
MAESPDAQTQLKKKARRRLIGAVAFAGLAAVVLPMVMDEEPKQQMQDVQIRIPGQDLPPVTAGAPAAKAAPTTAPAVSEKAEAPPLAEPLPRLPEVVPPRLPEPAPAKPAEKKVEKAPEKPPKQTAEEAQRAAAILAGKSAAASAGGGQYVILIGAFANAANVKTLEGKIGELGIKTYKEPLDSPEGKKIRLRAGPFTNREVADKALERMKRIGVNGVVAAGTASPR